MPTAQFADTTGTASCSAGDALPASYLGDFVAKLQMTELLKPFESEVKSEVDAGHFPWDKETLSASASFTYTVTFPQGVQVGAAAVALAEGCSAVLASDWRLGCRGLQIISDATSPRARPIRRCEEDRGSHLILEEPSGDFKGSIWRPHDSTSL